ncbi:unnamed protein product (macronuclear) [Paramecium tetraurelia]|uniref:Uncharacterized protein n=1 Tax=Paramecium tetraurelia TaxID=5888 RepID=A0DDU1_PARTE|nr:uncharacterized protein GSPATT00016049001 [Paramecium tetraurelia]CAK81208.1 unnamed protein product [Paramecium tetraurelia]|eukprot:XP_001448605.1 hypothetical protein (macronuclear) [Paramecium tetraurelia strain d4-2]
MSGINININLNLEKNKAAKSKGEKLYDGEPKKKKKKQGKSKQTNQSPLPWGLNQERLKNYIFAQLAKRDNLLYQQQMRKGKEEEPKEDRREILGVSFLNHLPKRKIKQMINKQKVNEEEEQTQYQPKFNEQQLQEIRMYKEWKKRQIQFEMQFKKQQEIDRQTKIQQNLQNLNEYIKYRNHTTSVHQKKSVSFHKKKRTKSSMADKKKELIMKYQNLANRYAQINGEPKDNQSCFGLVLDSDQEGISQMDSIHKSTRRQHVISEPTLDEDEEQQIQELGNLEKEMAQIVKAAIIIQKVWRGYKTRQILSYYKNYVEDDEDEIKLDQLTPNLSQRQAQLEPICQSVQIGKEQSGLKSSQKKNDKNGFNTFIDQLDWDDENEDQFNSQKVSSIKKLPQQKSNHKIIIEKQKQQWHQMLEHISQLQRKGSKQNIKEVLQDLKAFTLQLTNEIDGEMNEDNLDKQEQQQSVEMSEIRQVMGSENLVKLSQTSSPANKDASLFEQNPFYDFASKKFKELLNREYMNKLIQMRETAIEERQKNEMKNIHEALQQKQISPKTYEKQKFKIEKWVTKEKEDFKQQKSNIENGWKGLYETFMRTQKDLLFMSKLKNQQLTSSFSSENVSNLRLIREINSGSQSKIVKTNNFDTVTMNFSSSICESQDIRKVPKTSPSPSPRQQQQQYNQQQIYENLEWDDEMLYTSDNLDCGKIQQSQVIKVSTLIHKEPEYNDSQIQSYSILIANSIIGNEIQDMYEELKLYNKDITTLIKFQQSKGIKTNIQQVKVYLAKLESFLLQSDRKVALIQRINTPLGPTPKEILKFFHYYDEEDDYQSSEHDDQSNQPILQTEQYAQLENQLMEEEQISSDDGFLLELEHIHNKVLYDALNEALDYFRPFGLNGYPLPWIKQPLELIQRNKKSETLQEIFQGAIKQVTDWASFLVGLIIDKPDSPFPKILMLDQEYLNQIKEERMIRMLNQEIYQNEERWLIYDEEQSEILVEISQMVQDQLMDECLKELIQFQ